MTVCPFQRPSATHPCEPGKFEDREPFGQRRGSTTPGECVRVDAAALQLGEPPGLHPPHYRFAIDEAIVRKTRQGREAFADRARWQRVWDHLHHASGNAICLD